MGEVGVSRGSEGWKESEKMRERGVLVDEWGITLQAMKRSEKEVKGWLRVRGGSVEKQG